MAWDEFRGLVSSTDFPDSEKRKLQDKFRKLRQGDRSVREYERKILPIVNYVRDMEPAADNVMAGKSCLMLDIVWSALEACDTRHLSIARCEACHGSLVGLVARTWCIGADSECECDPTRESVTVWDLSCSWLECVRIPK
uniref:Retrotransposon gag domain-containing protein n=1 Tax=Ananas comosus var. bracteatus TaxID=296719 RepID=A0A6V7QBC6_ANACO|nr:unnamed protein product [Ananas comosus var. bracteatus]